MAVWARSWCVGDVRPAVQTAAEANASGWMQHRLHHGGRSRQNVEFGRGKLSLFKENSILNTQVPYKQRWRDGEAPCTFNVVKDQAFCFK